VTAHRQMCERRGGAAWYTQNARMCAGYLAGLRHSEAGQSGVYRAPFRTPQWPVVGATSQDRASSGSGRRTLQSRTRTKSLAGALLVVPVRR